MYGIHGAELLMYLDCHELVPILEIHIYDHSILTIFTCLTGNFGISSRLAQTYSRRNQNSIYRCDKGDIIHYCRKLIVLQSL